MPCPQHRPAAADAREPSGPAAARWLPAAIAAALGLYVAIRTIGMVVDGWTPLPTDDQWEELISGREVSWSWLRSQHNEHRLVIARLIFLVDYWLAGEANLINFAVNIIIPVTLTVLMVYLARGAGLRRPWQILWAAGFTPALLFWSGQYQNFLWGFQVQFLGVILAAVATFTSLALGGKTAAGLAAVIVLAAVAVYTLASGMIVPFLCVVLALWLGRPGRVVIALAVTALLLLAGYLAGYHTIRGHSDPTTVFQHSGDALIYALANLGGPIGNALAAVWGAPAGSGRLTMAAVAGAGGVLIFAVLVYRGFPGRRADPPHQAALLALAGFGVATSLLTASGRVGLGLEQALDSRYATPAVAFWAAVSLLAAARSVQDGQRRAVGLTVLLLSLPLLLAVTEGHFVAAGQQWIDRRRAAIPAVLANVADNGVLISAFPNPAVVLPAAAALRSARTSVFKPDWSRWLGTPLANHVVFADGALCQGGFDKLVQISADAAGGWRATGRAFSALPGQAPQYLVLTDAAGLVAGYGVGGLDLAFLGVHPRSDRPQAIDWIGAVAGEATAATTAFALLNDGLVACRLGRPAAVLTPIKLTVTDHHPPDLPIGGAIDAVTFDGSVTIAGWGWIQGRDHQRQVMIDTNLPVRTAAINDNLRSDVAQVVGEPRLADAGFWARLELDPAAPQPRDIRLCVWTEDPLFGSRLLPNASRPDLCPADSR